MSTKPRRRTRSSPLSGGRWLCASLLALACGHDTTAPAPLRYDITFDDSWAIYETPVDSPQVRLVMQDTLTTYDISWSPDGRRVAFTREYMTNPVYYRVVIFNTVDGTQSELTHGPDDSFQPAWSPDGTHIAYLSRPPGGFDATLRTVRPDGTDDRQLDTTHYYVRPPDWSPDSRQLAATRNDLMVVVIDAATGSVVRAIASGMSPTWSPDGRRLAFVASGITITDADGTNAKVIPFTAYEPAWSPDGPWIAVQAGDIYLVAPDSLIPSASGDSTVIRRIAPGNRPAWRFSL
jgi:Tol biopolymer transport system component